MWVVCDTETNGLTDYTILWVVVLREIETGKVHVFERPDLNPTPFYEFAEEVTGWVGHNFLGFDLAVLAHFCPALSIDPSHCIDTLVVSRLVNYAVEGGHSLDAWGERVGVPKVQVENWIDGEQNLYNERCATDTLINLKVYKALLPYIASDTWKDAIWIEHYTSLLCKDLHNNGFYFDIDLARTIHAEILEKTTAFEKEIDLVFPPRLKPIREIHPKATKYGTLNRSDFRWVTDGNLGPYSVDAPFTLCELVPFNPASPKQVVERLNEAGWKPINKTDGHIEAEKSAEPDRLTYFKTYGWRIDEENLGTIPTTAPDGAKRFAEYLTLLGRLRRLEEWFGNYNERTHRIHGNFNHIGSWTHRLSHDHPNMANIPRVAPHYDNPTPVQSVHRDYNGKLRTLWSTPNDRLIIGVDAEGIQLRILAHYMNEQRFIDAVTKGKKEDGTDPHSLNRQALGSVCLSRDDAKTFIYAFLLGAGVDRIAEILGCSREEARQARENFIQFYTGLRLLRDNQITADAKRGFFQGFDGRFVLIRGDDFSERKHFALGGYLQNGEVVVMKRAAYIWHEQLRKEKIPFWFTNFVHDEFIVETHKDTDLAEHIKLVLCESIKQAGEELNLKCPMKGEGHVGDSWLEIH